MILLSTTRPWQSAARLAAALSQAGCTLEAVCPAGNPLHSGKAVSKTYPHRGMMPLRSLDAAIRVSEPDLVVPCDDFARHYLHRLHAIFSADSGSRAAWGRDLIERSLGNPGNYSCLESRDAFMAMARAEGIRTPDSALISSEDDLRMWLSEHKLPAVLKADGTMGGDGVRRVSTPDEAMQAFRQLRSPLHAAIVLKRTIVDKDLDLVVPCLRRRKRTVSVQSFVHGRDATISFACWQGNILASISVEVLQTCYHQGPSAVVRVLDDEAMLAVARKVARKLGLSGLCGLDFVIETHSGTPYLLEINPRATQICHLALAATRDIPGAVYSMVSGKPRREVGDPITNRTIALFPNAWQLDPDSHVLRTAYHDVPWAEPALVRDGVAPRSRITSKNWLAFKALLQGTARAIPLDAKYRVESPRV